MMFRRTRFLSLAFATYHGANAYQWWRTFHRGLLNNRTSGYKTSSPLGIASRLSAILNARFKAAGLFFRTDLQPVLQQNNTRIHHGLSTSGVICRNLCTCWSVQKPITRSTPARLYQLRSKITTSPAAGKCAYVTLEIHLAFLALRGRGQCHHAKYTRTHAVGDRLDGPAFPGAISSFKNHAHPEAFLTTQCCSFTSSA